MTREEIEKLEGWELAAAVAEHAMGWPKFEGQAHREGSRPYPHFCVDRRYAKPIQVDYGRENEFPRGWAPDTDIAAAWQVVEKFNGDFEVRQQNGLIYRATAFIPSSEFECWAPTAPLAICRAALLAVFATPAPAAERGAR
jgi:hypothetical protein